MEIYNLIFLPHRSTRLRSLDHSISEGEFDCRSENLPVVVTIVEEIEKARFLNNVIRSNMSEEHVHFPSFSQISCTMNSHAIHYRNQRKR